MSFTEVAEPPASVVIETSATCNLRCPSCGLGAGRTQRKGLMGWDLFCDLANQIAPFAKRVYLHLWGEPTLHPNLGQMIRRVKEFAAIDVATNGMFVTEESAADLALCDALSVSIDGIDQKTYEIYRVGGNLGDAMEGLRILAKHKPGGVNWTWVVNRHNEHQIEAAKALAKELGVSFGAKPPYFIDEKTRRDLAPKNRAYWRYKEDGSLKADRLACHEFWATIYFAMNGDCVTCCYDYDAKWIMGSLRENTVLDIWNGPRYRAMRRRHLAGELNELCGTQCSLP